MGLSRSTKAVSTPDLRTRVRRFYAYQGASSFAIWIPFWALWIHPRRRRVLGRAPRVPAPRRRRRGPHAPPADDRPARAVPACGHPGLWDQRDVLGYVAANIVWSLGA